jgi:hypothetical protein
MTRQDFTCSITANIPLTEAFDAVAKRVPEWWTKNFEGNSQNTGDVFSTHFGETCGTFKIEEIIPCKKIVWRVIDCNLHFLTNKKEWKDTKMLREFSNNNNVSQIQFTPIGLTTLLECYEDCCGGGHIM